MAELVERRFSGSMKRDEGQDESGKVGEST